MYMCVYQCVRCAAGCNKCLHVLVAVCTCGWCQAVPRPPPVFCSPPGHCMSRVSSLAAAHHLATISSCSPRAA